MADPESGRTPPILLNREPIPREAFSDLLAEAAGIEVLEAVLLDRLVRAECDRRGIVVDEAAAHHEEEILREGLHSDSATAARLLEELRRRRQLGERRYALLLWTNARLRALVRDQVSIDPERLRVEYARQYGPRFMIRILTLPDRPAIEKALLRIQGGENFIDLAVELSTDLSADRGGLIGPISPVDPEYPQVIRDLLTQLSPGETSSVAAVEAGFCLVHMVRRLAPLDVPFESVEDEIERSLRRAMERQQMNGLAAALLREAEVIVLDPALNDAWQWRNQR